MGASRSCRHGRNYNVHKLTPPDKVTSVLFFLISGKNQARERFIGSCQHLTGKLQCVCVCFCGRACAHNRHIVTPRLLCSALKDRPPPIIRQGPANQTQVLGGVSLLRCQASGEPEPTVTWRKNGVSLAGKDPRFSLLEHGSLQIQNTKVAGLAVLVGEVIHHLGNVKTLCFHCNPLCWVFFMYSLFSTVAVSWG